MATSDRLRMALAALFLIGGLVHLQQYVDGFSAIPIIGPMFLINGAGSVIVAALLIWRKEKIWVAAAGAIALGSLAAIVITRGPGMFGYISTTFEAPEAVAVISEAAALLLAAVILIARPRLSVASS